MTNKVNQKNVNYRYKADLIEALEALGDMYAQYCPDRFGHDFMSAGERAIEVLEKYGLALENQAFDWAMFEKGIERLRNE